MTSKTPDSKLSTLSFVMPVLNEEKYLRTAVESIFEQGYSSPFDIVLALGPSTDNTNKIAEELAAEAATRGQKSCLCLTPAAQPRAA